MFVDVLVPYSCFENGIGYIEQEEFRSGPNGCSICRCVSTKIVCNDEACPRPTTPAPTTTTTTQAPVTPFVDGPRGDIGYSGDRGEPGLRGQPVSLNQFFSHS